MCWCGCDLQAHVTVPSFYISAEDLNSERSSMLVWSALDQPHPHLQSLEDRKRAAASLSPGLLPPPIMLCCCALASVTCFLLG